MDNKPEAVLPTSVIDTLGRWAKLLNLVHDVAWMRYYQKGFFKEKDPERKRQFLIHSKTYEKKVDDLLDILWPESVLHLHKPFNPKQQ